MSIETLCVKFTRKNYSTWEFQFKMLLKVNEFWGHIDGSSKAPEDTKDYSAWETKDAGIISWILEYMDTHMVIICALSLLLRKCGST